MIRNPFTANFNCASQILQDSLILDGYYEPRPQVSCGSSRETKHRKKAKLPFWFGDLECGRGALEASLGKLSLRVCIRSKCMSGTLDTPRFLNLHFGCEINATVVWLRRRFCNDRSSDFPLFAQEAARLHGVLSPLAPAFFSSPADVRQIDRQGDFKPAIERHLCQIARAFADVLVWQSCTAESKCNSNSFVAAQSDDSYKRMDKHPQTTSKEICRPWLPVPPSKICGQDNIWREDMCRCWVGPSPVCQRCCSLVLALGFVIEPSVGCTRSWSHGISKPVFLEGGLSIHAWSACRCSIMAPVESGKRKLRHFPSICVQRP